MENKHIAVGAAALAVLILAASCAAMNDEAPGCLGAGQRAGLSDTVVPVRLAVPASSVPRVPRVAPPAVPARPAAPLVKGTPGKSLSKTPAVTKAPAASPSPHRGGGSHGGGFHIDLDLDGDGC